MYAGRAKRRDRPCIDFEILLPADSISLIYGDCLRHLVGSFLEHSFESALNEIGRCVLKAHNPRYLPRARGKHKELCLQPLFFAIVRLEATSSQLLSNPTGADCLGLNSYRGTFSVWYSTRYAGSRCWHSPGTLPLIHNNPSWWR